MLDIELSDTGKVGESVENVCVSEGGECGAWQLVAGRNPMAGSRRDAFRSNSEELVEADFLAAEEETGTISVSGAKQWGGQQVRRW